MPAKPTSKAISSTPRLPPLPKLRVRRPNQSAENPCLGIMSSVLSTSLFPPCSQSQLLSMPTVTLSQFFSYRHTFPPELYISPHQLHHSPTLLPTAPLLHPPHPPSQPARVNTIPIPGCWASSGHNTAGCIKLEQALRACMDEPRPKNTKKNTINYHLSRLYPKISGARKRDK